MAERPKGILSIGTIGLAASYLLIKMKRKGLILFTVVCITSIVMTVLSPLSSFTFPLFVMWIIIAVYLYKKIDIFE